MAHPSEPTFLVLHALRLKGFAEADVVAATTGLHHDDVAKRLDDLAGDGLVQRRQGRISGWALTAGGRARHLDQCGEELDASGMRATVDDCYRRFLAVNPDMLAVCTDWQLRDPQTINDHADAAYDRAVIARLVDVHDRVRPVTAGLGDALDRFAPYGDRLRSALEKVEAGQQEWFTKPVIDSYHTVWFELHEDLLSTLGIERASEGAH